MLAWGSSHSPQSIPKHVKGKFELAQQGFKDLTALFSKFQYLKNYKLAHFAVTAYVTIFMAVL